MEGDDGHVVVELDDTPRGRIGRIVLSNERKRNAISPGVVRELHRVCERLANDDDLRVVVLGGAGDKAFAAGADIRVLAALDPETAKAFITRLHLAIDALRGLPVPVIGRLRGHCLGAGMEIAAACDFRAGDTSVVIGMPEVKVGIPSVIEAMLLPGLIGWGKTRELLLTGVNASAEEALAMGFLQRLCDPGSLDAVVNTWVEDILGSGPKAVRSQKALLRKWEHLSLADGIDISLDYFADAFKTGEPAECMRPFVERSTRRER
jgi:enoyl-CoA hydratase/carnithine racemase